MKRITIVAVFAVFSAFGMGCLGQSTSSEETVETSLSSARKPATEEEQGASFIRGPSQALELNLHPNNADNGGESRGPHPEPWLQYGPHPEPWTGLVDPEPQPDTSSDSPSDPPKPKP